MTDTMEAQQPINSADVKAEGGDDEVKTRKSSKEAFLRIMAQEMLSALNGEEDEEDQDLLDEADNQSIKILEQKLREAKKARQEAKRKKRATKRSSKSSQEDEAKALAASQELYGSPARTMKVAHVDELDDHLESLSFANLDIDDLINAEPEGPAARRMSETGSSRNSLNASANSLNDSHSRVSGQSSSMGSDSGILSVEEIKKYLMESLPANVRDNLPKEAWDEIFASDRMSKAGSRSSGSSSLLRDAKDIPGSEIVGDDASVSSDISDITGFQGDVEKPVTSSKRRSLDHTATTTSTTASDPEGSPTRSQTKLAPKRNSISCADGGKKVKFNHVAVRYYKRIITDNPSVQGGVAIGIGWAHTRPRCVSIDDWELRRGEPRSSTELVLNREERDQLAKSLGYSQKETADMTRIILKTKNQRKQTVNNLSVAGAEEAIEAAKKKMKSLITFGKKKAVVRS